jgi:selenium metabolism protein YedF
MSKIIDCRGLACPKPVILAKKEFESIDSGEFTLIVDNDAARQNVQKFAESVGCVLVVESKDGLFYVKITKEGSFTATDSNERELVILITSDKFGSGDDSLGAALMKSYLYALSESDVVPRTAAFLNAGIKLTTEGSDVLESIRKLEEKGTEVLSCGTCLDFYNAKEKLLVGKVSNMYTIVEKMNSASNTIKL